MIIKRLEVEGFKIIGDPTKIDFQENGKIAIAGRNETGKSTLLDSIEFALYGLKQGHGSNKEDIITWGKEKARVVLQFIVSKKEYLLQREVRKGGGHNVKLIPIINGALDKTNALTNKGQVEEKIEQLLGLDRHAFSKLVYIKQKDLDALKDLQKASREQLLNKVMGIEVFDHAIDNIKQDKNELKEELELMEHDMETIKRNKKIYETRLDDQSTFERALATDSPILDQLESKIKDMNEKLAVYEWSTKLINLNRLADADKQQLQNLAKEQLNLEQKEKDLNTYNNAIGSYRPEMEKLEQLSGQFKECESSSQIAERKYAELDQKRKYLLEAGKYSSKDAALLSSDLTKEKQTQLRRFAIFLTSGLILLALTFVVSFLIFVGAIGLIAVSMLCMRAYLRADKLFVKSAEIKAVLEQMNYAATERSQILESYNQLVSTNNFKSSADIQARISDISTTMRQETGIDNIDGLEAVAQTLDEEIQKILADNPSQRIETLEQNIAERQKEIALMVSQKPANADTIPFDEAEFNALKNQHLNLSNDYNKVDRRIAQNKALLEQAQNDLNTFRPDYERYPVLEGKVLDAQKRIYVLERVEIELSETSKELRNKVIPSAKFFINKILPLLTNDRYSDFDITDDLKFKVHSMQAGDYKQREVFSGGTQDQFLIALRLAFTQSILNSRTGDDRYCLLMDESISSSDDLRKHGIFDVLDMMKGTFSQILIIAHEDISAFVDHNINLSRNANGYTEIKQVTG